MPDSDCSSWQTVHFEQEATGQFTRSRVTGHITWDVAVEDLTCGVHVFTDLHLEWNVPDMMQAKRYQRTFNHTVDTECHNRVLVSSPLGEGLDCAADWRPDEGQNHTQDDSGHTGDDWHKAFTGEEAQIFWQLDTVETVEHVCRNRTRDNTAEYAGIRQMAGCDFFSRQMQNQRCYNCHGFHHDAVSHNCRQCRNTIVVGKA